MEYNVKLAEIFSRTIKVEADSEAEAIETISIQYNEGELNLDYDEFDEHKIEILNSNDKTTN